MGIEILALSSDKWAHDCAIFIQNNIENVLSQNGVCNIVLTGGNTASIVYKEMSSFINMPKYNDRINIFFTDERCVARGNNQTNFEIVRDSLFGGKTSAMNKVNAINGAAIDIEAEVENCNSKLKNVDIDILLLSLGADGHVASLFFLDTCIKGVKQDYIPVIRKIPLVSRISITPYLIKRANTVFVMAKGVKKVAILKRWISGEMNSEPISLLSNAKWIIEKSSEKFLYEK